MWNGGEERRVCRVLMGLSEEKGPLGRTWLNWDGSIKMVYQKVGCGGMECIKLVQDKGTLGALVSTVMNLWVS
jgi:hypothetical protein